MSKAPKGTSPIGSATKFLKSRQSDWATLLIQYKAKDITFKEVLKEIESDALTALIMQEMETHAKSYEIGVRLGYQEASCKTAEEIFKEIEKKASTIIDDEDGNVFSIAIDAKRFNEIKSRFLPKGISLRSMGGKESTLPPRKRLGISPQTKEQKRKDKAVER